MSATLTVAHQPTGDIETLARSFVRALRAANRSPRTIDTYLEAVEQFAAFLASERLPLYVASVGRDHVRAFIEALLGRHKPATASARFPGAPAVLQVLRGQGGDRGQSHGRHASARRP